MAKLFNKSYNLPVEATLEAIGGKWKTIILCHLSSGRKRTSELKKGTAGISQKMLTEQLREMEEDGLILRTVYNEVPPKVVYELTDLGRSLKPVLSLMCEWGDQFFKNQSMSE